MRRIFLVPQPLNTVHTVVQQTNTARSVDPYSPMSNKEMTTPIAGRMGPLDGLRQLVCVLVEIMPNSLVIFNEEIEREKMHRIAMFSASGYKCAEGSSMMTPAVISRYLTRTLGNMPEPEWGCPNGPVAYLSDFMSVVLERPISIHLAYDCVSPPFGHGNPKTAPAKLTELGLFPGRWKHPLVLREVRKRNAEALAEKAFKLAATWALVTAMLVILVWFYMFYTR